MFSFDFNEKWVILHYDRTLQENNERVSYFVTTRFVDAKFVETFQQNEIHLKYANEVKLDK